jgi:DsbC/DsbD-like thiol-disulfide interchange protein
VISDVTITKIWVVCHHHRGHFKTMIRTEFHSQNIGPNRRQLLAVWAGAGAVCAFGVTKPVLADTLKVIPSSSASFESSHSSIKLLAASASRGQKGLYQAAIAMRVRPGFKTYWRHPGDSGVPPVFDFSGSQNLGSAVVSYPAPKAFPDGAGGQSYGYSGPEVLFPVFVTAVDPAKPVLLQLKADYAVCEKICIPANGLVQLSLSAGLDGQNTAAVMAAVATLPTRLALGPGVFGPAISGQGQNLRVTALRKSPMPEHFIADVQVPADLTPALFVEGETPWLFESKGFTRLSATSGEMLVAVIERSKAADCTGAELVLTLVADKLAIEVPARLDLALVTH